MADEYISVMDPRWRKPDEQKARTAGLIRGLLDISPLAALDAPKQAMQYIPSAKLVGGLLGLGKVEAPTDAVATALGASRPSGIYSETAGAAYDAGRAVPQAAAAVGGLLGMNAPKVEHGKLNIFAGVNAKTADKAALSKAEEMTKAGKDPRQIWSETGWFKGVDGKWRFEIDDSASTIRPKFAGSEDMRQSLIDAYSKSGKLQTSGDVLNHDLLSQAYPETKRIQVTPGRGAGAGYFPEENRIALGEIPAQQGREAMLHELQHRVQDAERFTPGGSPDEFNLRTMYPGMKMDPQSYLQAEMMKKSQEMSALRDTLMAQYKRKEITSSQLVEAMHKAGRENGYADIVETLRRARNPEKAYERIAGEAEARAVQRRMDMTAAQRRALLPLDSHDVKLDDLIVK